MTQAVSTPSRRTVLAGALAVPLARPAIAAAPAPLRFVPQANLTSLDPIWTTATVTTNHAYYVYDTLYGSDSKLRPQPQMAEGAETSPDGRTWRIRLREGLKFHDGSPVRAVDCAASLARWSKRDAFGQILGKAVESWGAADDRTVEIKLTRPFPLLLQAIAKPDALVPWIMPEALAKTDASTAITTVIGSGPYRFLPGDYVSGSSAAYAKFEDYLPRREPSDWGSGGKAAHYERIEWRIIPDSATASAALRNGEVDWWEQPLADLLPQLAKAGIQLQIDQPQGRLAIMRLNCLHPPFNDPRIRRAVMMAVNQEDYMRAALGDDASLWSACRSLYPCGTAYSRETLGSQLIRGDLKAARALLKEAGYAGQRVVIINPTDFPVIGPLGQVTAAALREIGMNVDLQETDWGSVVQRRVSKAPVEQGGWSIFHTFGSAPAWVSPAVSLIIRGQGQTGWFGWWENARVEELTDQFLAASGEADQARIAGEIGDLALSEAGTIPLGRFYIKTAFRKQITGILQGTSPYPWNVRPA